MKETGKGLSSNDYTDAEKEKLAGIAENANNYVHPEFPTMSSGLYIMQINNGHVSKAVKVSKEDITALGVADADDIPDYQGSTGISIIGNTIGHSNYIPAGTAGESLSTTLRFGKSFQIPWFNYDAQGHLTAAGTRTVFMPPNPTDGLKDDTKSDYTPSYSIQNSTSAVKYYRLFTVNYFHFLQIL